MAEGRQRALVEPHLDDRVPEELLRTALRARRAHPCIGDFETLELANLKRFCAFA